MTDATHMTSRKMPQSQSQSQEKGMEKHTNSQISLDFCYDTKHLMET